jgi:nucleoside-diphosphate-sugar epimerase
VTGRFNVWQAAVASKARGLVFSSSMGVYGDSRRPVSDQAVAFLDEDAPLLPGDVYGWTKLVGEELCRYHGRHDGIPSIALRYGMYVPETFFRYGMRLLYGGVDEEDVVEAVMAAVEAFEQREVGFEVYNVESPLPFTAADSWSLRTDPLGAIERHWPGATELLRAHGVRGLRPITEVFPVRRLEDGLGIRPLHDFGSWLDQLANRPEEQASAEPPWP